MSDDRVRANGPSITGDEEPAKGRFIKTRGKSKSPPWHRVVVYDCDRNTLEVRHPFDLNREEYQKVKLPVGSSQVTIFLDSQTVTTPTIKETAPDGESNVKLAKIYLNKLGLTNSVLRFLGQIQSLYVKKIKPWSETSSSTSSVGGGGITA